MLSLLGAGEVAEDALDEPATLRGQLADPACREEIVFIVGEEFVTPPLDLIHELAQLAQTLLDRLPFHVRVPELCNAVMEKRLINVTPFCLCPAPVMINLLRPNLLVVQAIPFAHCRDAFLSRRALCHVYSGHVELP
jgi:hypothetical protein